MSMASDLFEAIGRGHHNSLTMWAKKHNIPLQSGGSWPDRVKMATSFVSKPTKEGNMPKPVPKANTKPKKQVEEEVEEEEAPTTKKGVKKEAKPVTLGSKEVADMLGIPATSLRRYLRAHGHNTQGEYARYEWDPDGAALQKLLKEYKAYAAEANKGENLKKGSDAKRAGKGKTKPVNEDVEEEEEEEEVEEME